MKVLWVGDAVISSGFAKCTHAVCDELHRAGHEVNVIGMSYFGDPHQYPYSIYPAHQPIDGGYDGFGVSRLPVLMERLNPDVVVLLNDPWNVPAYLESIKLFKFSGNQASTPVIGWIAVDAKNQRGEYLNQLSHVVTWTQFAIDELRDGGYEGEHSIVPLGIDREVFNPKGRIISRQKVCPDNLPEDAFLVGVVGRNQPRKRLDLSLEYFAEWVRTRDLTNAYLYLHVAPTGDKGCDVRSLVKYYGIQGKVILASPQVGVGVDHSIMPYVYSAQDVVLSTTQGEGWGLCTMEAMACGVINIVPDFSALGEWTENAAIKVPCYESALSAPLNSLAYTVGGVVDREKTLEALDFVYAGRKVEKYIERGLELVSRPEYQWNNIGISFREIIESIRRD